MRPTITLTGIISDAIIAIIIWLPILLVATLILFAMYGGVAQLEASAGATHYIVPATGQQAAPDAGSQT